MTVKTLIQEAINKNALGFEQSLKEELRNRVALALEAKMKSKDEEGEEESDDTVKESAQLDEISLKLLQTTHKRLPMRPATRIFP